MPSRKYPRREELTLKYVLEHGRVDTSSDCWIWQGPMLTKKYGRFGSEGLVHRLVYFIVFGEPGTSYVCHSCDSTLCVRPDHLWLGTQADNLHDMAAKGRARYYLQTEEGKSLQRERMSGDNNPARVHGNRVQRGDDHWSRRMPDRRYQGDAHWTRRDPERAKQHAARMREGKIKPTDREVT